MRASGLAIRARDDLLGLGFRDREKVERVG